MGNKSGKGKSGKKKKKNNSSMNSKKNSSNLNKQQKIKQENLNVNSKKQKKEKSNEVVEKQKTKEVNSIEKKSEENAKTNIKKSNKSKNKKNVVKQKEKKNLDIEVKQEITNNKSENIKEDKNKEEIIKEENIEEKTKNIEENQGHKKNIKKIIFIIVLTGVIIGILALFIIPGIIAKNGNKMVSGVYINGVDVEGLTYKEAEEKLNNSANNVIKSDIKIVMGEYENTINLSQISASYNIQGALYEAYKVGREDNIFKSSYDILKCKKNKKNIDLDVFINKEEIKNVYDNISQDLPGHVVQWSYSVNNDKVLTITKGKKGLIIDEEETTKKIKEAILEALKGKNIKKVDLITKEIQPDEIDVDKIHEEIYREPKDAYVTQNPFAVYVHVNGIDFNVDDVKKLVSSNDSKYNIDLIVTEPKITTKDLGEEAFPDLIGKTYKTTYSLGAVSRNTNIELAAKTVNGTILMPGETFSYNGILGDTTADKGYKPAGAYLNGQVIQSYGGGICQVSSTIYNAVLYANLDVNERYNHSFLSGYVPAGLDATVSYGSKDFKFTNNRKFPIKLVVTASNGTITASIYGVKQEDDCEVELQSIITSYIAPQVKYEQTSTLKAGVQRVKQAGSSGCKCTVYITKKRKGKQISKEVLHNDIYSAKQKIILQGTRR